MTLDDVLLFHLMPDSNHFCPAAVARRILRKEAQPTVPVVGCTSVVDRDADGRFIFARNMDWDSLGVVGTYSLVVKRRHSSGHHNTLSVGVPGLIGTVTGMNVKGLSIAMNVCPGKTTEVVGMPSCLFNREVLERCEHVSDVDSLLQKQQPLGPYHLTVVDSESANAYHLFQAENQGHWVRVWKTDALLVSLNCRYQPEPCEDLPGRETFSKERQEVIDEFFKTRRPLVEVLALPYVNNWRTTHQVVMLPKDRKIQVSFDNAFAASAPLQDISALLE